MWTWTKIYLARCLVTCFLIEGTQAFAKDMSAENSLGEGSGNKLPPAEKSRSEQIFPSFLQWRFQASYGLWPADTEVPSWDRSAEAPQTEQLLATALLEQNRFGQSVMIPFNPLQATRVGVSLLQIQTANQAPWAKSFVKNAAPVDWQCWGLGGDLFISRQQSNSIFLEAGLQAESLIAGRLSYRTSGAVLSSENTPPTLEQSGGWRIAFSGGMSGFMLGPVGMLVRLNGYILKAHFRGHPKPFRAQGFQLEVGADLALGRSEQR